MIGFAARFCGRLRKRKVLGSEGVGKKVSVRFCCANAEGKRVASACCVTAIKVLRFLRVRKVSDICSERFPIYVIKLSARFIFIGFGHCKVWPIDRSTDRAIDRSTDRAIERSFSHHFNIILTSFRHQLETI